MEGNLFLYRRPPDRLEKACRGYRLFTKEFDSALTLVESHRHAGDPDFSDDILLPLRSGTTDASWLRAWNDRSLSGNSPGLRQSLADLLDNPELYIPYASWSNKLRLALIWRCLNAHSLRNRRRITVALGAFDDYVPSVLKNATLPWDEMSKKLGALPCLPLEIGMPVAFSISIPALGINNGGLGTLVGWRFPPETQFEQASLFGVDCNVAGQPLDFAMVELDRAAAPQALPDLGYDQYALRGGCVVPIRPVRAGGTIPCPARTTAERDDLRLYIEERHRRAPRGRAPKLNFAKVPVTFHQVPIVPGFAFSYHKLQGRTLDGLVMLELNVRKSPQLAYLGASRVRRLNTLFLSSPFTYSDQNYYRPESELHSELLRLAALQQATLLRLQNDLRASGLATAFLHEPD